MSINMADSGSIEYADHEVQVLSGRLTVEGTSSNSAPSGDYIHNTEAVSDRGIDSDELAELVAMYRTVSITVTDEQSSGQAEPANVAAETTLGINLGPDELPTRTAEVGTDVTNDPATIVVNDQGEGTFAVANFEEPGVLDVSRIQAKPGFEGAGGGGSGSYSTTAERSAHFQQDFGSGPYLDRTDDLSLSVEINPENIADGLDAQVEITYILYWNVEQMPEGRASFARP